MTSKRSRFVLTAAVGIALTAACSKSNNPMNNGTMPIIDSFSASKTTVPMGATVTLSWTVENATNVSITAAPDNTVVSNGSKLMGTADSAALTHDTTFKLVATSASGKTATQMVMVTVNASMLAIVSFAANPRSGLLHGMTVLSWQTQGATSVKILQTDGTTIHDATPDELTSGMFAAPLPDPMNTFTLVAKDASNSVMQSVTVNGELPPMIMSFTATPMVFTGAMQDVVIAWSTSASMVSLNANGTPVPEFPNANNESGMLTVRVTATTVFELIAAGGGMMVSQSITVAKAMGEMEPNDDPMHANMLGANGGVSGTIVPATDVDWFSVTVPAGGNINAQLLPADGNVAHCPAGAELTLYTHGGTIALGNDSIPTNTACASIDPRVYDFAHDLAGGTYFVVVDTAGTSTGAYTLTVMVGSAMCGNGIVEHGEQCDDGPMQSANCSSTCTIVYAANIMPPGGVATVAAAMTSDFRIIQVTLTTDGQSISFDTRENGTCGFQTDVIVSDSTRTQLGEVAGSAATSSCAVLPFPAPVGSDFAQNLAHGTYYLTVSDIGTTGGTAKVNVTIHDPVCGDGVTETLAGEQCDDGNTISGDGCSSTCKVEPLGTLMGPPGMNTFNGTLAPAGRIETYQLNVTHEGYVSAETGVQTIGTCAAGDAGDTILDLTDTMFHVIAHNDDISSTDRCSRITPYTTGAHVMPGTYYLRAYTYSTTTAIARYQLQVKLVGTGCGNGIVETNLGEQCDPPGPSCSATCQFTGVEHMEVEPNNDSAHATLVSVPRGTTTYVQAAITPVGDIDFFAFDITGAAGTVIAGTHTSPGDPMSCAAGTDTELELFNALGVAAMPPTPLATNDDIGVGDYCSRIDGTQMMQAANLPAGRYYLRVHQYIDAAVIALYYLDITVR
jgi:cysteine-rich repeat protein